MRMKIEEHPVYHKLEAEQVESLYETAKKNLRVGFEIELNRRNPDENGIDEEEALEVLNLIKKAFEAEYGFSMAIGKGERSKKKLKRCFSDGRNQIEVPVEIDIDGYIEHFLVPYGYFDGSTPIELVTSPVIPTVKNVKDTLERIYKVTRRVDQDLVPICLDRCGLHQTLVFEHLGTKFPENVAANAIQITRAYVPGIFHLFSSGNLKLPSRSLEHRGHNPSLWRRTIAETCKYSLVYPRNKNTGERSECWGVEFRYPDGTQSTVLPGLTAVVNAAIVLKAIKLSQYGILKISDDYYQKAKTYINRFIYADQISEIEIVSKNFFPRIIAEELMSFLSDEINEIDKSAWAILQKLNARPLWAKFGNYEDMKREHYLQIDNDLVCSEPLDKNKSDVALAVAMDSSVSKERKNAVRRISRRLMKGYAQSNKLLNEYGYIWSPKLAKFVLRE